MEKNINSGENTSQSSQAGKKTTEYREDLVENLSQTNDSNNSKQEELDDLKIIKNQFDKIRTYLKKNFVSKNFEDISDNTDSAKLKQSELVRSRVIFLRHGIAEEIIGEDGQKLKKGPHTPLVKGEEKRIKEVGELLKSQGFNKENTIILYGEDTTRSELTMEGVKEKTGCEDFELKGLYTSDANIKIQYDRVISMGPLVAETLNNIQQLTEEFPGINIICIVHKTTLLHALYKRFPEGGNKIVLSSKDVPELGIVECDINNDGEIIDYHESHELIKLRARYNSDMYSEEKFDELMAILSSNPNLKEHIEKYRQQKISIIELQNIINYIFRRDKLYKEFLNNFSNIHLTTFCISLLLIIDIEKDDSIEIIEMLSQKSQKIELEKEEDIIITLLAKLFHKIIDNQDNEFNIELLTKLIIRFDENYLTKIFKIYKKYGEKGIKILDDTISKILENTTLPTHKTKFLALEYCKITYKYPFFNGVDQEKILIEDIGNNTIEPNFLKGDKIVTINDLYPDTTGNNGTKDKEIGNRNGRNIIVLGEAGTGKTTSMHMLINKSIKNGNIPLFVNYEEINNYYNGEEINFEKIVAYIENMVKPFINILGKEGITVKVDIIIDGLNEFVRNQNNNQSLINDIINYFRNGFNEKHFAKGNGVTENRVNNIIFSSRKTNDEIDINQLEFYETTNFELEVFFDLLRKEISSDQNKAKNSNNSISKIDDLEEKIENIIEQIRQSDSLQKIITIPLISRLFIFIIKNKISEHKSLDFLKGEKNETLIKAEIFNEAIKQLTKIELKKASREKRPGDEKDRIDLLGEIAEIAFGNSETSKGSEIMNLIKKSKFNKSVPIDKSRKSDDDLLDLSSLVFLTPIGEGNYKFIHSLFQEYFIALYHYNSIDSQNINQEIYEKISKLKGESLILFIGIINGDDNIKKHIDKDIKELLSRSTYFYIKKYDIQLIIVMKLLFPNKFDKFGESFDAISLKVINEIKIKINIANSINFENWDFKEESYISSALRYIIDNENEEYLKNLGGSVKSFKTLKNLTDEFKKLGLQIYISKYIYFIESINLSNSCDFPNLYDLFINVLENLEGKEFSQFLEFSLNHLVFKEVFISKIKKKRYLKDILNTQIKDNKKYIELILYYSLFSDEFQSDLKKIKYGYNINKVKFAFITDFNNIKSISENSYIKTQLLYLINNKGNENNIIEELGELIYDIELFRILIDCFSEDKERSKQNIGDIITVFTKISNKIDINKELSNKYLSYGVINEILLILEVLEGNTYSKFLNFIISDKIYSEILRKYVIKYIKQNKRKFTGYFEDRQGRENYEDISNYHILLLYKYLLPSEYYDLFKKSDHKDMFYRIEVAIATGFLRLNMNQKYYIDNQIEYIISEHPQKLGIYLSHIVKYEELFDKIIYKLRYHKLNTFLIDIIKNVDFEEIETESIVDILYKTIENIKIGDNLNELKERINNLQEGSKLLRVFDHLSKKIQKLSKKERLKIILVISLLLPDRYDNFLNQIADGKLGNSEKDYYNKIRLSKLSNSNIFTENSKESIKNKLKSYVQKNKGEFGTKLNELNNDPYMYKLILSTLSLLGYKNYIKDIMEFMNNKNDNGYIKLEDIIIELLKISPYGIGEFYGEITKYGQIDNEKLLNHFSRNKKLNYLIYEVFFYSEDTAFLIKLMKDIKQGKYLKDKATRFNFFVKFNNHEIDIIRQLAGTQLSFNNLPIEEQKNNEEKSTIYRSTFEELLTNYYKSLIIRPILEEIKPDLNISDNTYLYRLSFLKLNNINIYTLWEKSIYYLDIHPSEYEKITIQEFISKIAKIYKGNCLKIFKDLIIFGEMFDIVLFELSKLGTKNFFKDIIEIMRFQGYENEDIINKLISIGTFGVGDVYKNLTNNNILENEKILDFITKKVKRNDLIREIFQYCKEKYFLIRLFGKLLDGQYTKSKSEARKILSKFEKHELKEISELAKITGYKYSGTKLFYEYRSSIISNDLKIELNKVGVYTKETNIKEIIKIILTKFTKNSQMSLKYLSYIDFVHEYIFQAFIELGYGEYLKTFFEIMNSFGYTDTEIIKKINKLDPNGLGKLFADSIKYKFLSNEFILDILISDLKRPELLGEIFVNVDDEYFILNLIDHVRNGNYINYSSTKAAFFKTLKEHKSKTVQELCAIGYTLQKDKKIYNNKFIIYIRNELLKIAHQNSIDVNEEIFINNIIETIITKYNGNCKYVIGKLSQFKLVFDNIMKTYNKLGYIIYVEDILDIMKINGYYGEIIILKLIEIGTDGLGDFCNELVKRKKIDNDSILHLLDKFLNRQDLISEIFFYSDDENFLIKLLFLVKNKEILLTKELTNKLFNKFCNHQSGIISELSCSFTSGKRTDKQFNEIISKHRNNY